MGRDYRKLRTFQLTDQLVIEVYRITTSFPKKEMFGLTSQLRRASVSVPTNIVEGSHRSTIRDYMHFLDIALGSLAEVGYLLDVSTRLGYIDPDESSRLAELQNNGIRHLSKLIRSYRSKQA